MRTLFTDAVITTMMPDRSTYRYMITEGETIIGLFHEYPAGNYDRVISLKGRYVYPGLCDSHLHLLYSIVLAASSFNICRIRNGKVEPEDLKGIETEIRDFAGRNHSGLLMINQYISSAIRERRLPLAEELDLWTGDREAVVFSMDGHSCSMSTKLMRKLELESDSGIFSGAEHDRNQGKITSYAASKVTPMVLAKGLAAFHNQCLDYGITKVCALDGDDTTEGRDILLELLVFLAARMDIDVRLYPEYMNFDRLKKVFPKMAHKRVGGCGTWELDGSVGSHSAAFSQPYRDTDTRGELYYESTIIREKLNTALEEGMQTTAHAIGTEAIDQLTEVYRTNREHIPTTGPWVRMDHFEFPSEKALKFAMENRVAVTVQPGYAYADKRYLHTYEEYLDPADLQRILPLKTLAKGGALLLGSSDSPVQSINPFEQMRGMTEYYREEESLSSYEALKTYTCNAAEALDEPDGRLYVGGPATFFITGTDILNAGPEELASARAEAVYLRGRKLQRKRGTLGEFLRMLVGKGRKI